MKYFSNESGFDCFRSSLCNLLLEFNDLKTANLVFSNFQNHRFTQDSETLGINIALTTKLVRDLTNQKYNAVLQTPGFNYDVFNQPYQVYDSKLAKKMSKCILKEFDRENIILTQTSEIFSDNYILSTNSKKLNIGHFLVQRNDGYQINDGIIQKVPKHQDISAILQLYKTK